MKKRGWPKGQKRGESKLKGKKQLDIDLARVELILSDAGSPPEDRFAAVFEMLLDAMQESANRATANVGYRLRSFWDVDMANTHIWTPSKEADGNETSG